MVGERDVRLRYETAPARRQRILDLVRESGFSNVSDMATLMGVSEMTVRRDFRKLAELGLLRQVHGGVSALTSVDGPIDFRLRAAENQEAKRAIANYAVGLIEPGAVVGLDAGTTTLHVAKQMPEDLPLTVVTHSLPALSALAGRQSMDLIGLGGHLHAETQAFSGSMTVRSIADIRVGIAILAATAIRSGSMWCTNTFDAETKQALINASDRVVLLADSSKFQASAVMRIADLQTVSVLVTDDQIERGLLADIRRIGVEVHTVSI